MKLPFPSVLRLFALGLPLLFTGIRAAENQLSAREISDGWQLLFNGESFEGWRGYREEQMPRAGWEIKDGTLRTIANVKGGNIITQRTFTDFELSWEWRISPGGNNGVKYFVSEARPKAPGHEYQMLDDTAHPDSKMGVHRQTAAFYDVLPPAADKPLKKPGEWNRSRIVVQGKKVEHWLNGKNVLTYELGSPEVKAAIAKSKFKSELTFGRKMAGHIMLTYHADECWFRNVKVRELR